MPWMTGPAWAQVQGLDNIYRSTATPTPATAPSAPAGGDYWSQLGSLLGMTPTTPQAQAYTPWWQQQQQRAADVVPGAGMSIPGAGAFFAQLQQMQQQAQAPSNVYGNMPMLGQSTQGSGSGVIGGGRFLTRERARELEAQQRNNQRNRNPLTRADGSIIDAEAYMRGDRPGMTPNPRPIGSGSQNRPQLAPPNRPAPQSKRPSSIFGEPTERGGITRASIPGFSNFAY